MEYINTCIYHTHMYICVHARIIGASSKLQFESVMLRVGSTSHFVLKQLPIVLILVSNQKLCMYSVYLVYVYCLSKNIVLLYSIFYTGVRKLRSQTLLQIISSLL